MHEKTLRTIGATLILAALAVIGITQANADEDGAPVDIATVDASKSNFTSETTRGSTTPAPFIYRVGMLSGVTTSNFWAFYGEQPSAWNSYVLGPTKPALYTVDSSTGALEPELAAHEAAAEKLGGAWSVRVELNPELSWSDGVPVSAHDLVFTFDTVRRLDLGGSWADSFPATVADVRAVDDHNVVIEFSERPRLAVWPHAVGLAPVMPEHIWGESVGGITSDELFAMRGERDVGGGPLHVASVSEGLIKSVANPGYALADPPDIVEYHVFDDDVAATEALTAGDVDYVLSPNGLNATQLESLHDNADLEVVTSPGNGIRYVGFNLTRAPMSAPAFRRALALLLDRGELDAGPEAWSLVPEANTQWYEAEDASAISQRYRRPLAKRLSAALAALEKAGYEWETVPSTSNGELVAGTGLTIDGQQPQPLTILTPGDEYDPARPEYAKAIADTLEILGFDARPVVTDFDTVVDLAFTPGDDGALTYDMYMLGWTLGNPALPGYYRALFAPDGPMNNTGYRSDRFDRALAAYENAFTREEARKALWQMERVLADDLPYLLLYSNEISEAFRSDRLRFDDTRGLGGLQARLGGIWDVEPAG